MSSFAEDLNLGTDFELLLTLAGVQKLTLLTQLVDLTGRCRQAVFDLSFVFLDCTKGLLVNFGRALTVV